MTKISLIHPSWGRPEKAKATYNEWMKRASGKIEIEHILALDFSDPKNKEYEMDSEGKYKSFGPNSKTITDKHINVVDATNSAALVTTGDILIYMSDDFECPENWDMIVSSYMILSTPCMLRVNDGHQPFENRILTIPIMNRKLYERLRYFFCPEYASQWVDCDLFAVTEPFIINAPNVTFRHVEGPDDETYKRNRANFESGREIFQRRQKEFNWKNPFLKSHI